MTAAGAAGLGCQPVPDSAHTHTLRAVRMKKGSMPGLGGRTSPGPRAYFVPSFFRTGPGSRKGFGPCHRDVVPAARVTLTRVLSPVRHFTCNPVDSQVLEVNHTAKNHLGYFVISGY